MGNHLNQLGNKEPTTSINTNDVGQTANRKVLRSTELQRLFHSGPDLIHDLAEAGEIQKASDGSAKQGVNASPTFTRASVVKLLEKRRIS